jgi:hypothetical protein
MRLEDRFENAVGPVWDIAEVGNGMVVPSPTGLWLTVNPTPGTQYSNAQITDYYFKRAGKLHFNFGWRPPLRMTVTARAQVPRKPQVVDSSTTTQGKSGSDSRLNPTIPSESPRLIGALRGTAGFGFWNHPFSPDMKRLPRLPQAIWFFFGSPPNNMQLAYGVPGCGWKAATIDATRALYLAPFALPAVLLMRVPRLYKLLWKPIQRALKIGEVALDMGLLASRHTYTIDWHFNHAIFTVDDKIVLETPFAPGGALGFVAWLDNQYAVVTPQGHFGFGTVAVAQAQALVLERVMIETAG